MKNNSTQTYYVIRHKDTGKIVNTGYLYRDLIRQQYKDDKKKVPNMMAIGLVLWSLLDLRFEFPVNYGCLVGRTKLDLVKQLEKLNWRMKFTFNTSTQKYKEELFIFDNRFEIIKVKVKLTKTVEVV